MRLDDAEAMRRLTEARFGILGTVGADGSPHVVPVVFVVVDDLVGLPVDRVKAKRTTRLQRVENLARRGRGSLLVDHRSERWDELWWVRAEVSPTGRDGGRLMDALAAKYEPYRRPGAIDSVMELSIDRLTGWSAA